MHIHSLIPASNWINWIPQLITLLIRNDDTGKYVTNLMHQIVRQYPLALYYPLRTLYLKLKNDEQTEKLKYQFQQQLLLQQQKQSNDVEMKDASAATTPGTPKTPSQPFALSNTATESLIRVTTLMHRQREMHPTLFNTLEGSFSFICCRWLGKWIFFISIVDKKLNLDFSIKRPEKNSFGSFCKN